MATVAEPVAPAEKMTYLKDYRPPDYFVDKVKLTFELDDAGLDTRVIAELDVRPSCPKGTPLILDAEALEIAPAAITIDGASVPHDFDKSASKLTIAEVPDVPFKLTAECKIAPAKNTELTGLYMSDGCFVTQCEALGFRRILPFVDRPDNMSTYTVRIVADKKRYPVLLSNGNLIRQGDVESDPSRHWAEYEDPWKKPSYLFAVVAGDLVYLEDTFTTMSGKEVKLRIYVSGEDQLPKCKHAMRSLKNSMAWDEKNYGLEYDLEVFNIVAVNSFTFGAMENKSLNIFNSKYILCSPETATDRDFNAVEGVVAHEYFHNYSGNRVTVSSWFQLSLKEGLTVFRDQSFSADMNSAAVHRIGEVDVMRSAQFAEDSGPMAHPIQPKAFQTINNFYTVTVYDKGAEVIRMLHTLCGPEGYRKGTDNYFKRHDGKAITTDEWTQAIHDANPEAFDLKIFRRWYDQAGTPSVTVTSEYDKEAKTLTLKMKQVVPPTHDQAEKLPQLIPVKTGLIGPDGAPVKVDDGNGKPATEKVFVLQEAEQFFVLKDVPEGSMPSMLRNFSAPVRFSYKQGESVDALAFQMAYDTDEFSRWEAGQKLAMKFIRECMASEGEFPVLSEKVIDAFKKTWVAESIDKSLRAEAFGMPFESYVLEELGVSDPVKIRKSRSHLSKSLAVGLEAEFKATLEKPAPTEYKLDPESQGDRAMRNTALAYLCKLEKDEYYDRALAVVREAPNMTQVQSALGTLAQSVSSQRDTALAEFAEKWKGTQLVLDKWIRIQTSAARDDALEVTKKLMEHEAFKITVPNSVYALLGGYAANMHIPTDGSGYQFMADQVIRLDKINAMVAARIARTFTKIKKYDENRQKQMKEQLERIAAVESLSKDVGEIVGNCLKA